MNDTTTLDYPTIAPAVYRSLGQVHGRIDALGLARTLQHLLQLRASQINGCAHCIKMHLREARADQESQQRLDELSVWQHSDQFSAAERAALAWTEALTTLSPHTDYAALRDLLRSHFSAEQIAALTTGIAMINLWNRINISNH